MTSDPHGWSSLGFRHRPPASAEEVDRAIIKEMRNIQSSHWMPWENLACLHDRALKPFGAEPSQDPEHPVNRAKDERICEILRAERRKKGVPWEKMSRKERFNTVFFGLLGIFLMLGLVACFGLALEYCTRSWSEGSIGWVECLGSLLVVFVMKRLLGR